MVNVMLLVTDCPLVSATVRLTVDVAEALGSPKILPVLLSKAAHAGNPVADQV